MNRSEHSNDSPAPKPALLTFAYHRRYTLHPPYLPISETKRKGASMRVFLFIHYVPQSYLLPHSINELKEHHAMHSMPAEDSRKRKSQTLKRRASFIMRSCQVYKSSSSVHPSSSQPHPPLEARQYHICTISLMQKP